MYALKIMLRHPDSYEESCWYTMRYFPTKSECLTYLEINYASDITDPDSRYMFEIYEQDIDTM